MPKWFPRQPKFFIDRNLEADSLGRYQLTEKKSQGYFGGWAKHGQIWWAYSTTSFPLKIMMELAAHATLNEEVYDGQSQMGYYEYR